MTESNNMSKDAWIEPTIELLDADKSEVGPGYGPDGGIFLNETLS